MTRPTRPTAAAAADQLETCLAHLEARAGQPDEMDEMALAAAERYENAGDYRSADLIIGLVSLDQAMRAWQIPQMREEARKARARANRIAATKASGKRLALPDLDAGLRSAS